MGMTVYCYRPDYTRPVVYGPVDEYGCPPEAPEGLELELGWCDGPHFSNSNACMIFRTLGLHVVDGGASFDATELMSLVTLARATEPIKDDGMPDIVSGGPGTGKATWIDCGVRPGYFTDAYEQIAAVCEQAIEWKVKVIVA